jgi:hypothetical protein
METKKKNKQTKQKNINKTWFFNTSVRLCIKKNNGKICNVIQQSDRVYNVTFLREYIS